MGTFARGVHLHVLVSLLSGLFAWIGYQRCDTRGESRYGALEGWGLGGRRKQKRSHGQQLQAWNSQTPNLHTCDVYVSIYADMCIYVYTYIFLFAYKQDLNSCFSFKASCCAPTEKTTPCCRHVILSKTLVGPFVGMCNFLVKATSSLRLFYHLKEPHVYYSQKVTVTWIWVVTFWSPGMFSKYTNFEPSLPNEILVKSTYGFFCEFLVGIAQNPQIQLAVPPKMNKSSEGIRSSPQF